MDDESNDDCTVENSEDSGIKIRLYAPKNGKAINKITDREKVIGELNEDYAGYLCELYSKCNTKLLRVHTEAAGYEVYLSHYMNSGSGWNVIEEKEFGTKLKDMKK
ncbi:hypothetical protein BEWA_026510 [Theileria equi strain WA]|uniref:Uncharacterized protein n=1 Tax=Theileria equi strain WA TaxID=1537102 RepID=L0AW23_THEEQ|nr:hypothetical protein BEWA_026510 [Theileria equi strain WA]AFZ79802.1 hypothetical protein BEWA_026510 [Theileria equi strain WA]|eukprot:XP_004829468.1 hypothetical protein BEWA_026510 [Theileria equi strain WA]